MNVIDRVERKCQNPNALFPRSEISELLRLAKVGQTLVEMHKECSDCSTVGICADVMDCFEGNDSCCNNCDCYGVCESLVEYYGIEEIVKGERT